MPSSMPLIKHKEPTILKKHPKNRLIPHYLTGAGLVLVSVFLFFQPLSLTFKLRVRILVRAIDSL